MIKIAVCDDEEIFREQICRLLRLKQKEHRFMIDVYSSGKELLEQETLYDMVYLDIQLQDMDGLELARRMKASKPDIAVIFVTSYPRYATQAFSLEAYHFVIKPIDQNEFMTVLEEALSRYRHTHYLYLVETESGIKPLDPNSIRTIQVDKHELLVACCEGITYRARGVLQEEEEKLIPYGFVRTYRSVIANMKYFDEIRGETVLLADGSKIPLSRGERPHVLSQYTVYLTRNAL